MQFSLHVFTEQLYTEQVITKNESVLARVCKQMKRDDQTQAHTHTQAADIRQQCAGLGSNELAAWRKKHVRNNLDN